MTVHPSYLIGSLIWIFVGANAALHAQDRLSLSQAIETVLAANPDVVAARAATHEAEQQVPQARAGFLPRLDFIQSWQRGNQPIFVFGSLLAQRQFAEADFALPQLNNPEPLTNSRSALSLEQVLFDGGRTRSAVRGASLAAATAKAAERQTRNDLVVATTRAYGQVLRAEAERRAAESAVAAADEDARTAAARRDAGTGTESDVLSMRVHLAQMRARSITAVSTERIARADLNRLMSASLDREWLLDEPTTLETAPPDVTILLDEAMRRRPEIEQAALRRDLSRVAKQSAQSTLWPNLALQGGYEWNDGRRSGPAGAWIAGASLRVNLFSGGTNSARVREASHAIARAEAEQRRVEAAVRLEVLTAKEQLSSARARHEVSRAAVMQARESQRMIRDRYEAGMAQASDVIRAATAVLDAEAQLVDSVDDVIVGEASVRRAAGGQEVHP
jgi:outer membrane protein TolC